MGNDLNTLPDYPAEIRAPAGTLYGVSGFQLHFSSVDVNTPGDTPDVLVAMNPAALKKNLGELKKDGIIIVNTDSFDPKYRYPRLPQMHWKAVHFQLKKYPDAKTFLL